jgi:Type I phosphodiesterase / nucleotide pyrophosphatase
MQQSGIPAVGLADLAQSIAAHVGTPGAQERIAILPAQHVVMVLIDGLGYVDLVEHQHHAPFLAQGLGDPIRTVFPSTTPAGLATVGTGLLPGQHGMVAATFELPETGSVLTPLHWPGDVPAVAVQPEPTLFERAARAGVTVTSIGPSKFAFSGLTKAVLRGATYAAADSVAERVAQVSKLRTAQRAWSYVYWPDLDKVGHVHGSGSPAWIDALKVVDQLVAQIAEAAGPEGTVIVTSDHGMISGETRLTIEQDTTLMQGIRLVAGEPRCRHLYCEPGAVADVVSAWRERLGDDVLVHTRDALVESGIYGPVDEGICDRIGDVVVEATAGLVMESAVDPRSSALLGQHGARTARELLIPAIQIAGQNQT